MKFFIFEIFGSLCRLNKNDSLIYKIFKRGKDRIEKEMDILWIIKRIRKIKILSK